MAGLWPQARTAQGGPGDYLHLWMPISASTPALAEFLTFPAQTVTPSNQFSSNSLTGNNSL